jgi:orotate phosphoribosyltransferase
MPPRDNGGMSSPNNSTTAQDFIAFAVQSGVIKFGEFITKAGRKSPYFFNAGLFNDGAKLQKLGEFYAKRLLESGVSYDMLFGPAYKGITLAASTACELARRGHNVPFAFNRKEAKDHGEGGVMVGAPVNGRVMIIDDVISAGTAVGESVQLIRQANAQVAGVLISLDRQEMAGTADKPLPESAVQHVQRTLDVQVLAIATLADLLEFLDAAGDSSLSAYREPVRAYRARYGVI